MIKINLTPFEELDNPRWWLPDLIVAVAVLLLTFGGVYLYVDSVEQEIAAKEAEKQTIVTETAALAGDVARFNELDGKITTVDARKNALKRITESKLVRFLPVILMENIQNLKPEKVWLTGLQFVDKKKEEAAPPPATPAPAPADGAPPASAPPLAEARKDFDFPVTIEITGAAVDNVAIAEFMLALKATQNQSFETSDLRSQLFFSDVGILFSAISTDKNEESGNRDFVTFKLILSFKEKVGATQDGKFSQFIDQFNKTGKASIN